MADNSLIPGLLPAAQHDPGGSKRWPLQPGVRGAAQVSSCGRYRPALSRTWAGPSPYMLALGTNPSTAEAEADDPTIRKLISVARREGMAGLVMTNVCDYRATNPMTLLDPAVRPRSDDNLPVIVHYAKNAALVLCAWGALPKPLRAYAQETVETLAEYELWCLGTTADGSPRHPLYVRNDTPLARWHAAS